MASPAPDHFPPFLKGLPVDLCGGPRPRSVNTWSECEKVPSSSLDMGVGVYKEKEAPKLLGRLV